MNDDKADLLETPQISRFQHENVFALSFQTELTKPPLLARVNSTFDGTSVNETQLDITETALVIPPTPVIKPPPVNNINNTSPPLGNFNSAPKKAFLNRNLSQNDAEQAFKLNGTHALLIGDARLASNNHVNINNSPHQLVDQNNNDLTDSLILESDEKTLLNRSSSENLSKSTAAINISNDFQKNPLMLMANGMGNATIVKAILSQAGQQKPVSPIQIVVKNMPAGAAVANTANNNGTSNTIASIILQQHQQQLQQQQHQQLQQQQQQKRTSPAENGLTLPANKAIKTASPVTIPTGLLLNSNSLQYAPNDDILIDTKALMSTSSNGSENSCQSDPSADDMNYEMTKKSKEEKRKEKRRTSATNNEVRKQQIRNSNREAARRCRERRRQYIETLESNIKSLESKQKNLSNENSKLKNEIHGLRSALAQHKECSVSLAQNTLLATIAQQSQQPQQQQNFYLLEIPNANTTNGLASVLQTYANSNTTSNNNNNNNSANIIH